MYSHQDNAMRLRRTDGFDIISCSCHIGRYDLRSDYSARRLIYNSRINLHREQGEGKDTKAFDKFYCCTPMLPMSDISLRTSSRTSESVRRRLDGLNRKQ